MANSLDTVNSLIAELKQGLKSKFRKAISIKRSRNSAYTYEVKSVSRMFGSKTIVFIDEQGAMISPEYKKSAPLSLKEAALVLSLGI